MLDFTLHPQNVTINQVSIGKKKLTKSIFNQIESQDCFNQSLDFIGNVIIGYVKDKDSRYLVWVFEGKLRKTNLKEYYLLSRNPEYIKHHEAEWFLNKLRLEYNFEDHYPDTLSQGLEEPERYKEMVNKVKDFLHTLADKQIYL